MRDSIVNLYGAIADKKERDPYGPDGGGRATVVNGRGFQKWARFTREDVIWVTDADGRDAWLTRKQADLYMLAASFVDGDPTSIRSLAQELKCSPSTVSRGMVKLASLGLLVAITERGRYAATWIFRFPENGSLKRLRDAAKAKVRAWAKAASERASRSKLIVASYFFERNEVGTDSLYSYLESVVSKGATMNAPWSAEDVAGIE
jgi:predicted transcriptional regulator